MVGIVQSSLLVAEMSNEYVKGFIAYIYTDRQKYIYTSEAANVLIDPFLTPSMQRVTVITCTSVTCLVDMVTDLRKSIL